MKLPLGIIFLLLLFSLIFNTSRALAGDDDNNQGSSNSKSSNNDDKDNDEDEDGDEEENRQEIKVESKDGQTRVEVRERLDGDKTRFKQEIRTQTGKIKFEFENGKAKIKVETKGGEEEFKVVSPSSQTSVLAEIESSKEEKTEVKINIRDGRFELKAKGATALTNFPLSLNPETNELSVTTPAGTVVIKTLPQVAVQNILASNVMDRVLGQDVDAEEEEEEKEDVAEAPEVKVEGFVESLTDAQLVVSGVTFTLNESTEFEGLVGVGTGVKVKSSPANGVLVAQKVEVEEEIKPEIKVEGVVEAVSGSSITVSGVTFTISPDTKIEGNLSVGQTVELKANAIGGTLLANKIEVEVPGEGVVLAEEKGRAVFKIKGQKDVRFLNIFPVTLPIEAEVSVETGQVLSVSRPFLFNILGFLFRV